MSILSQKLCGGPHFESERIGERLPMSTVQVDGAVSPRQRTLQTKAAVAQAKAIEAWHLDV